MSSNDNDPRWLGALRYCINSEADIRHKYNQCVQNNGERKCLELKDELKSKSDICKL